MRYSTDTRTLRPGETYVAIRGERFDGHDFIAEAIRKGARGVVVERPVATPCHVAVTLVDNAERFLALEAHKKLLACGPAVVAITGSVGKTSTRNAITKVLRGQFPVLSTTGNLNTVLGISLTLLNNDFDRSTKVVLEMGASQSGDIAELCGYFPPDVSVVTNVYGVHLESFGTIARVARTKAEIVGALTGSGVACLNADDPHVSAMEKMHTGRTVRYGTRAACDIGPNHITATLPLLGDHAIYLALAAFSVGHVLGMSRAAINARLGLLQPEKGRLSKLPGRSGCTLIDDTYNASPATTLSALRVLSREPAQRRIAYLGDMLELGSESAAEHLRIIRAASRTTDRLVLVGQCMAEAHGMLPPAVRRAIVVFSSAHEAVEALRSGHPAVPGPADAFLVKGSQGVRMERISRALLDEDTDPTTVLCRQSESWQAI